MKIPEELKSRLLSELDFVVRKISEETEADRKLYFLSAAYGAVERTMRFCPESELIMAYNILNVSYSMLLDRLNRLKAGDTVIQLPQNWSEQMIEHLLELRKAIAENQSTHSALENIIKLAYSATGPGHYTKSYLDSLTSQEGA